MFIAFSGKYFGADYSKSTVIVSLQQVIIFELAIAVAIAHLATMLLAGVIDH
jgi:hypothetical protein